MEPSATVLHTRVGPAREGESFTTRNGIHTTVLPKCDTNDGFWYCVAHKEAFRNQLEKDIHIHRGRHRLAWFCHTHGAEVP